MFKRVRWMGMGVVVGAAGAFRAKRKVEAAVERYLPEQVAERAATSARGLAGTVRAAATEGRAAMRATETELRARVEARAFTGERPEPPVDPNPAPPAVNRPGPSSAGERPSGRRRIPRPSRPAGTPSATARRRSRR